MFGPSMSRADGGPTRAGVYDPKAPRPADPPYRPTVNVSMASRYGGGAILRDAISGTPPRLSTRMVDVARQRDTTIWDEAGTEQPRGGDPVDFLFDAMTAAGGARPPAVARLRASLVGGDAIDTIFGAR